MQTPWQDLGFLQELQTQVLAPATSAVPIAEARAGYCSHCGHSLFLRNGQLVALAAGRILRECSGKWYRKLLGKRDHAPR